MASQEGPKTPSDYLVLAFLLLGGLALLQGILHSTFFCSNPNEHHYESQSAGDKF